MPRAELPGDRLDFRARHGFRGGKSFRGEAAIGKKSLGHAYTADLERLQALGLEPAADDELGRSTADIDDQARLGRSRQFVRDAEIDQAGFFVSGDYVDRETEGALRLRKKLARVLGHAKGIGRHRTYCRGMQAGEALPEPGEAFERGLHRRGLDSSLRVEPGAETQGLAPGIESIDLIALDTTDLEAEAVRAQVDDGKRSGGGCGRRTDHGEFGESGRKRVRASSEG